MRFKIIVSLFVAATMAVGAQAQLTLGKCVRLAQENYPLIAKYELLERTSAVELSDINKSWLPQIGVSGRATVQNAVPSYPDVLKNVMEQMGTSVPGLEKLQYKVGVDLNQTVWDGGASKSQRSVVRASEAERRAALDVQLYAIRERVENLYFGILLYDEQTEQIRSMKSLLESNHQRVRSMKEHGVAMQSDVDIIEAQLLTTSQQLTQAADEAQTLRRQLGLFIGREAGELARPDASMPTDMTVKRPELGLYAARISTNDARRAEIKASLMPRIGVFAQANYGYPGFDSFKSMMSRDLTFNVMAGVSVTWNIGSFYTRANRGRRLSLASAEAEADRDVFLFNSDMQVRSQTERIEELRRVMADDARIVELRGAVRKAAESQLDNGVIDSFALLSKITEENQARLAATYHEIQLLQAICQLKYTVNQ